MQRIPMSVIPSGAVERHRVSNTTMWSTPNAFSPHNSRLIPNERAFSSVRRDLAGILSTANSVIRQKSQPRRRNRQLAQGVKP